MERVEAVSATKENITFRLDREILGKLRFEAEQRGASANAVAQEIFASYYDWSANAHKAGMVPVHKMLLSFMLDKVNEKEISKIAQLFADVRLKDMMLILRNDYSLGAFLSMFEAWMKSSAIVFAKQSSNGWYSYTISHEIGNKWSAFLSIVLQSVFKKMGISQVDFEVTDNMVMFSIPADALGL